MWEISNHIKSFLGIWRGNHMPTGVLGENVLGSGFFSLGLKVGTCPRRTENENGQSR